jgi:hypothetical protein
MGNLMPKFGKYRPTRKKKQQGRDTGHLTFEEGIKIVEKASASGYREDNGFRWYWGQYDVGAFGVAVFKTMASAATSVAQFITHYISDKPPRR